MKNAKIAIIFYILFVHQAKAGEAFVYKADVLDNYCKSENKYANTFAEGYILGAIDAISWHSGGLIPYKAGTSICLTPGTTVSQIKKIACKYLNDHPEELNENAGSVINGAIQEVFPCPGYDKEKVMSDWKKASGQK